MSEPIFFAKPTDWRRWLEEHHANSKELVVGFYKVGSGKASITWPESVDGALCFGWIDGVRRSLGPESYTIRFTPRTPRSIWSAVNIKRVPELMAGGLMHPAGLKAFAARQESRSAIYAFEQNEIRFSADQEKRFRANREAWKSFQLRPPWYQKTATWWVLSAKREQTKERRFTKLLEHAEKGEALPHLDRNPKATSA